MSIGLFSILTETGPSFYKDNRFWMTLSGIIILAIFSLTVI
jgi:hypothetical protein